MFDCDYKGGDIATINGITSLMRCAETCFNNNNCNFFTFGALTSICSLKTVSDTSQIKSNQGIICGMIEKRIPKLRSKRSVRYLSLSDVNSKYGRQFQTTGDSSYYLSTSCFVSGSVTQAFDDKDPSVSTIDGCVSKCKARPDICDLFVYEATTYINGQFVSSFMCALYKDANGVSLSESSINNNCGVMSVQTIPSPPQPQPQPQPVPSQPQPTTTTQSAPITTQPQPIPTPIPAKFDNVEFMPKCNYELNNATYTFYCFN